MQYQRVSDLRGGSSDEDDIVGPKPEDMDPADKPGNEFLDSTMGIIDK